MKKILIPTLFVGFITLMNACTKIDQNIYDTPNISNSIKTQSDVEFAIEGLYAQLNSWSGFKEQIPTITPYADDISTVNISINAWGVKIGINSGTPNISNIWNRLYQAISNANAVIGYTQTLNLSTAYSMKARAEAKFIRGLCYFYLVRYFGQVPITTTVSYYTSNFQLGRMPIDSVYQLIFSDFSEGTTALPSRTAQASSEFNRATQGAAQGFLAKAYLTYGNYLDLNNRPGEAQSAYANAKSYADLVINSSQYTLLNDYSKLWDVSNKKNAYNEVIFGVAYARDTKVIDVTSDGSNFALYFNPSTKGGVSGNGTKGTGNGAFRVQPWFYEKYTKGEYVGDYRVDTSFITAWPNATTGKNTLCFPLIPPQSGANLESQPYVNKYVDPNGLAAQSNGNDLFLLRFSEIYLIKAEAENEINGPTAIALGAFNKLRQRARLANGTVRTTPIDLMPTAVTTKEKMRMKIFDERGLELVGELNRWFDLVRMRYSDNKRTMYEYQFGTFLPTITPGLPTYSYSKKAWSAGRTEPSNIIPFDPKFLLLPIPANEIAVNANMAQNPGW